MISEKVKELWRATGLNTFWHLCAGASCRVYIFESWDRYSARVVKKLFMRCVRASNHRKHSAIIIRSIFPSIFTIEVLCESIIFDLNLPRILCGIH